MSQSAATIGRPARRPVPPTRPTLQLVTPLAKRSSNLPFVLLCSFVLAAGLIAVLFLNMQLSAGSYEMDRLQKRADVAADSEAKLREDLAGESSAGKLAQRATALGMVPGTAAMFLSLPDGKILGVAPKDPAKDPLNVVVDGGKPAQPLSSSTALAPAGTSQQPTQQPARPSTTPTSGSTSGATSGSTARGTTGQSVAPRSGTGPTAPATSAGR